MNENINFISVLKESSTKNIEKVSKKLLKSKYVKTSKVNHKGNIDIETPKYGMLSDVWDYIQSNNLDIVLIHAYNGLSGYEFEFGPEENIRGSFASRNVELDKVNLKVESSKSAEKLATLINKSITKVDPDLSYKDLAKAVSIVLGDEYGSHNFKPFIKELTANLSSLNESEDKELNEAVKRTFPVYINYRPNVISHGFVFKQGNKLRVFVIIQNLDEFQVSIELNSMKISDALEKIDWYLKFDDIKEVTINDISRYCIENTLTRGKLSYKRYKKTKSQDELAKIGFVEYDGSMVKEYKNHQRSIINNEDTNSSMQVIKMAKYPFLPKETYTWWDYELTGDTGHLRQLKDEVFK